MHLFVRGFYFIWLVKAYFYLEIATDQLATIRQSYFID